jgi:hypothetical protein
MFHFSQAGRLPFTGTNLINSLNSKSKLLRGWGLYLLNSSAKIFFCVTREENALQHTFEM